MLYSKLPVAGRLISEKILFKNILESFNPFYGHWSVSTPPETGDIEIGIVIKWIKIILTS